MSKRCGILYQFKETVRDSELIMKNEEIKKAAYGTAIPKSSKEKNLYNYINKN